MYQKLLVKDYLSNWIESAVIFFLNLFFFYLPFFCQIHTVEPRCCSCCCLSHLDVYPVQQFLSVIRLYITKCAGIQNRFRRAPLYCSSYYFIRLIGTRRRRIVMENEIIPGLAYLAHAFCERFAVGAVNKVWNDIHQSKSFYTFWIQSKWKTR